MAIKKIFCLKCAHRAGLFFMLLFVLCFSWWWRPADLKELRADLLRLAIVGFDDFNLKSFLLGLFQSYVWAYVGVFLWHLTGCCMEKCKK